MFNPLDGPARQFSVSLTTTVVVEVKVGTPFTDRQVVTLQPLDGDIWVYYGDGVNTPSAATVAADGFRHFKKSQNSYEVGQLQPLFILASTVTTSVRIAERA